MDDFGWTIDRRQFLTAVAAACAAVASPAAGSSPATAAGPAQLPQVDDPGYQHLVGVL